MKRTKIWQIAFERIVQKLGVEVIPSTRKDSRGRVKKNFVKVDLRHRAPEGMEQWKKDMFQYEGSRKEVLAELIECAQAKPPLGFGLTREEVRDTLLLTHVEDTGLKGKHYQSIKSVLTEDNN
jgi:hypothetical protein